MLMSINLLILNGTFCHNNIRFNEIFRSEDGLQVWILHEDLLDFGQMSVLVECRDSNPSLKNPSCGTKMNKHFKRAFEETLIFFFK